MHRHLHSVLAVLVFCTAASTTHAAGLLIPGEQDLPPLRVTNHSVNVSIQDQIALTTVNQTFHNGTGRRLEATYVFPLPENADLTDFQMSFNGKMVNGEVLPAEKAREIYEAIVRQTRDPGLIEFIGHRLLQMRVFPIEPNSDTKIQVKYQQINRPISGMNGYHYPLRTAKAAGQVYGTVRFGITLNTSSQLKNIWSPTHAIEIVRDGEYTAKIAYEASQGSLDEDFMLLYDTDSSDLGLSVIAYKPNESQPGHFVLTLTPKQLWSKQEYQPQDVVFVIDTSGSMAGEKIEQAKSALKYCIDQLDERDRFSVVRFSTGYDSIFQELVAATNENRARAREKIATYSSAGGTNIHDTLKHVLNSRPEKGNDGNARPFVIVFVTDGMGNRQPSDVLNMTKSHAAAQGARIFPFGVGHDVNTILLDQLATNYSGKPTYVQPGENLELVLGDFFSVISQPVLTNLKLTLPDAGASDQFPATLNDLYHGQQLILAGRFNKPVTGAIKLTAIRNNQEVEYSWPSVAFAHTAEANYVPSIWAGRKIAYLIDQIRAHGENKEMVAEIVALSQEYSIQTPYTSWLVNPERQIELAQIIRTQPMSAPGVGGLSGEGASPARRSWQHNQLASQGLADRDDRNTDASTLRNYERAEEAMAKAAGQDATNLAARNAQYRAMQARDGNRLNQNVVLRRQVASRWYNQIGTTLVDEDYDEETTVTNVRFASPAYFELIRNRADLRPALAASQTVIVLTAPGQAVLISENEGIENFSREQMEQLGILVR